MNVIKSVLVDQDSFVMNYPSVRASAPISAEAETENVTSYTEDNASPVILLNEEVIETQENVPAHLSHTNENMLSELKAGAYHDGYNEGIKAASDDFQHLLDQLRKVVNDASHSLLNISSESEKLIGLIVFEVVSKILGNHLFEQKNSLDIVKKTIREFDTEDILTIKVSDKDYKVLKDANDLLGISLNDLQVELDHSNKLGGARIELKSAYVDATLETQLHNFTQLLKNKK